MSTIFLWANKQVDLQDPVRVSRVQDRSSCGSSCWNCWRTSRARTLFRGRATDGSSNCPIRMKWPGGGASARTSPRWTTRSWVVDCATTTTRTSSTKRPASDTSTVLSATCKISWGQHIFIHFSPFIHSKCITLHQSIAPDQLYRQSFDCNSIRPTVRPQTPVDNNSRKMALTSGTFCRSTNDPIEMQPKAKL